MINNINTKIIGVCNLPGQGLSLQFDSSSVCPIHTLPDPTGAGSEHVLSLCLWPVLHDFVHELHDDQDDQPPFTEIERTKNVLVEYSLTSALWKTEKQKCSYIAEHRRSSAKYNKTTTIKQTTNNAVT